MRTFRIIFKRCFFGTGCSCNKRLGMWDKQQYMGVCKMNWGNQGPICYVNEPSTCKDLMWSEKDKNGKRAGYSWEACTYYKN